MKYIKTFKNHAQYEAFIQTEDFVKPNMSYCIQENNVHYNPWIIETRVVCKYNVTSTSEPTALRTNYEQNIFKSMEIDGVMLDELVTAYTFDTTGVHTVKYELYDETKLGNNAPTFYNSNLIEAKIPSSVTSIGTNAFNYCPSLTSCTFEEGSQLTSIGDYAFNACSGLTSITIPDTVTSIGGGAFVSCSGLTSVTIGSGVTSIDGTAFAGCSSLTSVTFEENSQLTSIGQSTFGGCRSLTSIDIPNSVTTIGNSAFGGCTSLTSVDIPSGVTSIGSGAFEGCTSLTSMTVDSSNTTYDSRNNCNAIIKTSTNELICGCKNTIIPNSVTSIGNSAFYGCYGLTSVDIPSGVTSIGTSAFQSCSGLTSITSNATTAPTIQSNTFNNVHTNGTLTVLAGSTGYDVWMGTGNYYLGLYNWTKVEQ